MNTLKIPQGISDFKEIREGGYYYVDKTQFIPEALAASVKILLVPRPRRFGKTLNMTAVQTWYERLPEGGSHAHLLDGLRADTTPGEHHDFRGKLPVIFLTFKDVKVASWEIAEQKIASLVQNEAARLSPFWEGSPKLNRVLRSRIEALLSGKPDSTTLSDALLTLCQALADCVGQQPLILIDEYDTPIHAAVQFGYYDEAVTFFRNFLSAGLKDNSFLWKGILTGILRVSKENLFSGLNNLSVSSLTEQGFETCFGLLESEVQDLLQRAELASHFVDVQRWYNGYRFGTQQVYNPWSVLSYVQKPQEGFRPYWVNTASTDLLAQAIADSDGILRRELEMLLKGDSVEKPIDEHVTWQKNRLRPEDVWSFLLFSGYLTTETKPVQQRRHLVGKLRVPNEEVMAAFEKLVALWTEKQVGDSQSVTHLLQALVQGREEHFSRLFSTLTKNVLSFHDVYPENSESFYHAFVTGLVVHLSESHHVRSNRESGYGRYDVMLEPKDPKSHAGVVIEFKVAESKENLQDVLASAHVQIEEKKYVAELEARGCARVLRWAIAFKGKDVAVSLREE